ncbi:prenyltransferase [bacterium]|nr:prenyltransferase [bacterium]
MEKLKSIVFLLRLPFLTVTLGSVFLGTAFAWWKTQQFSFILFLLTLTGACFLHISCNVINDYFDFKSGNDASNQSALVPFSGGSRILVEGKVSPKQALVISGTFALLGSSLGLFLNFASPGPIILLIGAAALFFIYNYNGFPLKLVNKGLGEMAIFLSWGPLMVFGAYFVQAQKISSFWPVLASIPAGILTTLVLLINEFADKEADFQTGRRTWVILFGYEKSLNLYLALAFCCYVVVGGGVLWGNWPVGSLLVFLTLPLPIRAFRAGRNNLENWKNFLPAVQSTVLMNFSFLVILSLSFVV